MEAPRFARFKPSAALAPYVECYWMLHFPSGLEVGTQLMPADGRVELFFSFGAGSRRVAADGGNRCDVPSRSYVLGGRSQGYHMDHSGAPSYVAVRFRPGGLSAFVRDPLVEMTDLHVDLDCLWDQHTARDLAEQLQSAPAPLAQYRLLEDALRSWLKPPAYLAALLASVRYIEGSASQVSMLALAEAANLSQKHFERLFARYVGFRPSLFARITRFQQTMYAALAQRRRYNKLRLGQLASFAGYYDQAHFTKDFKVFSGSTPNSFLSATHSFIQLTAPPKVDDFLQDADSA